MMRPRIYYLLFVYYTSKFIMIGDVAQMVERSLSTREVRDRYPA